MRYFLKDLWTEKTYELGNDEDWDAISRKFVHTLMKAGSIFPHRVLNHSDIDFILTQYNQTGKDTVLVYPASYAPRVDEHGLPMDGPNVSVDKGPVYELRRWLMVDETGRHVSSAAVGNILVNYKPPVYHSKYWPCGSHLVCRRADWPKLLARDNRDLEDREDRNDILELGGSRYMNLIQKPLLGWRWGYSAKEPGDMARQPHKSWKQKKCRSQWQKPKRNSLTYRRTEEVGEPLEDILGRIFPGADSVCGEPAEV